MTTKSYIPASDSEMRSFALNYVAQLNKGPELVGCTIEQAAAFTAAANAYAAAYDAAQNLDTRGPSATAAKNDAREILVDEIRRLTPVIQAFPGTTNQQRTDFRLTIRDTTTTATPVPPMAPALQVTGVVGNTVSLKVLDSTDLDRRAKPEAVKSATVFYAIGEAPPAEPDEWTFSGTTTKTTTQVELPPTTAGGTSVWLLAFYANVNTQSGPPSVAVQTWTQVTASNPAAPGSGGTPQSESDDQQPRLAA